MCPSLESEHAHSRGANFERRQTNKGGGLALAPAGRAIDKWGRKHFLGPLGRFNESSLPLEFVTVQKTPLNFNTRKSEIIHAQAFKTRQNTVSYVVLLICQWAHIKTFSYKVG